MKKTFIPIIAAIFMVLGIAVGAFYSHRFIRNGQNMAIASSNKLNALLKIVETQYVDSVNMSSLVEDAMPKVLAELDPHSAYIPASEAQNAEDDIRGSFSGIGIQFTIQDDTIHVNNVISGGPSEKVGLMAGDRIVSINDTTFVGPKINNNEAMHRLKGPKDTEVKLGIKRMGEPEILYFTIVRGDIPVQSVTATYLIEGTHYGYISIEKFAETTYVEMLCALAELRVNQCEGLIIDLRSNTGGFMVPAIQMANEFLPNNRLIVYTEGLNSARQDYTSNGSGSSQDMPLVVLVDENSASASEIFAGAIQDNDRGIIVGRRSFGKGLVQQPIDFADGSAIRLTIARYYTPSGRCIQKPYQKGDDENYQYDILNRYEHGEFFTADSIKQDESQVFYTTLGRKVYGGGGIMPDVFVPSDTTGFSSYYSQAMSKGLIQRFTFQYCDRNRKTLEKFTDEKLMVRYLKTQQLLEQFVNFAASKGLQRRNRLIELSRTRLEHVLYGNVIYNMLQMQPYIKFLNEEDKTVKRAVEILEQGKSIPVAPSDESTESTAA